METFMEKRIAALLIAGIVCAGAGAAQPTATIRSAPAPHSQFLYRTTTIVGADVRDARDRKIGDVKDLILGTKYHAIPWKALQPGDDGTYYILHADRETISQAPGFDRGKWPDLTERSWSEDVDRYWSRRVGQGMADANRLPPERGAGASGGGNTGSGGHGK
jgi:hypothetical protein